MPARRGLPSCSTERPKPRRAFGPASERPHRALCLQFAMTKQVCRLPESGESLGLGGCCLLAGSQSSLALQFSRGRRLSFGSEGIAGGRRWELSRTLRRASAELAAAAFFLPRLCGHAPRILLLKMPCLPLGRFAHRLFTLSALCASGAHPAPRNRLRFGPSRGRV